MKKTDKPWVQIAIDVKDAQLAKKLAKVAIEAGADWVEAGTPLIVFEGINSIKSLVDVCGDVPGAGRFQSAGRRL